MRTEQPTKCVVPLQKLRARLGPENNLSPLSAVIHYWPFQSGIVRLMDFKQGLDRTKNTHIVLKAKLCIKLKVIMSSFISRLSSGQKSVASYCKMGR